MPLQDLTPELRTRLSRAERLVGWFVIVATVLLLAGFAYYIYATAQNRGWFVRKINFATGVNDATGLKVGNPVKLMGFDVGELTGVNMNPPEGSRHGVTVYFIIREPYYNYIWWDSRIRVVSDLIGNRYLEVTKGEHGVPSVMTNKTTGKLAVMVRHNAYSALTNALTNALVRSGYTNIGDLDVATLTGLTNELMILFTNEVNKYYTNVSDARYDQQPIVIKETNYYLVPALDTPSLSDRLGAVASQLEAALPNFLKLTNQLQGVLSNANSAVGHLDVAIAQTGPMLTNLNVISGHLREPNGSLGNWLLPTNIGPELRQTLNSADTALQSAHKTLDSTDTNVTMLAVDLDHTLEHLADITSNLNEQVQVNSNLVTDISTTIVHSDEFIQGLKRHWLLRSAFKEKKSKKTNSPPSLKGKDGE